MVHSVNEHLLIPDAQNESRILIFYFLRIHGRYICPWTKPCTRISKGAQFGSKQP